MHSVYYTPFVLSPLVLHSLILIMMVILIMIVLANELGYSVHKKNRERRLRVE